MTPCTPAPPPTRQAWRQLACNRQQQQGCGALSARFHGVRSCRSGAGGTRRDTPRCARAQAVVEETVKLSLVLGVLLGAGLWLGGEHWLRLFTPVRPPPSFQSPPPPLLPSPAQSSHCIAVAITRQRVLYATSTSFSKSPSLSSCQAVHLARSCSEAGPEPPVPAEHGHAALPARAEMGAVRCLPLPLTASWMQGPPITVKTGCGQQERANAVHVAGARPLNAAALLPKRKR